MIVLSKGLKNSLLELAIDNALPAAAGPLHGATLRLFQSDSYPTENTSAVDLTEADFTGYAGALVTWSGVIRNDAGEVQAVGQAVLFNQTGTANSNTVRGWYLTGSDGAFLAGERFDQPMIFGSADRGEVLIPRIPL